MTIGPGWLPTAIGLRAALVQPEAMVLARCDPPVPTPVQLTVGITSPTITTAVMTRPIMPLREDVRRLPGQRTLADPGPATSRNATAPRPRPNVEAKPAGPPATSGNTAYFAAAALVRRTRHGPTIVSVDIRAGKTPGNQPPPEP